MPSAIGTSWLDHATAAIRSGLAGIVVSPNACVIVIGKAAALGLALAAGALALAAGALPSGALVVSVPLVLDEHAASDREMATAAATPVNLLVINGGPFREW
jgi:hypothetical protein